jgi:glucose/arabinose dehydrogenase
MARYSYILALATLLASGCGGSQPAPTPGSDGSLTIRGTERLGWDQQAVNAGDLATFRYAIYVDGARAELAGVTCESSSGSAGFACGARLPSMSAGPHTLELATYVIVDGAISESPRSSPLRVTVSPGSTAPADSLASESETPSSSSDRTAAGIPASHELVADGLGDPADLVFSPDGRLFVAGRDGTIRVIRDGQIEPTPALALDDGFVEGGSKRVMALALHPDFERTRFLYLLHTVAGRDGPVFRLSRYREAGGVLGERAVLLDNIPAASRQGAGAIRFGPDARLYVGLDDGDDPRRARHAASYNGKILRLNDDGSTPADQPSLSPVHASGFGSPCGLDWDSAGSLWVSDCRGAAEGRLVAVTVRRDARGRVEYQHPMPHALSDAAFYTGEVIPALSRTLLLASENGLLRVRFNQAPSRVEAVDRIGDADPVRAVAVGPDGRVYACVGTGVVRIVAPPAR